MRLVVQRVTEARVSCGDELLAEIEAGALVLAGIASGDTDEVIDRMADKVVGLRYFEDDDGRTNRSIVDVGGEMIVVSQFTLQADVRHGRRPGFTPAATPVVAEPLVDRFVARLRSLGVVVGTGRFGADMQVALVNDGPFTLVLESDRDLGAPTGRA